MIKSFKISLVMFTSVLSTHVSAQLNEWTWMHGDNAANQNGSFGVQGVPSPLNKPPALYEGCEWTDHDGNFWLYGGQHSGVDFYADMWKYDVSTNEWVWIKGPGIIGVSPVYGTQGVSSPTNTPGGRGWAPSSWVDNNNNLWMGFGCDLTATDMNNLWMYNINTNEWTWMKGANFPASPGNPGTMGVPSPTNEPSARHESTCSWIDANGDLWMYGGFGSGLTDDIWRYSISTNMWTWMKGDPMISNPPVYGTQSVSDPTNTPGGRCSYSRWADRFGNLWLFGGISNGFAGTHNDMWKYTIATNEWTWMKGANVIDDPGFYGSICTEDSANNPPARSENRSCWTDSCGHFWIFGGQLTNGDGKNDLWKFNPVTNNWTWVSGSSLGNPAGNFGSIGVSSPTNVPPPRTGSYAWQDTNGNLWMGFGCMFTTGSFRNDLWRFVPDPSCAGCSLIPVAMFSAPNHICPGTCTDFVNLSQGATSYLWTFNGANPNFSTDANPIGICYNVPGTYSVSLIATNSLTSDTLTLNNYITVYPSPPPQGIMQSGDTLFANAGGVSYQWYYGGNIIPGATEYFYVAPQSGNYNVVVTDANDCEVEAAIFDVIAEIQSAVGSWQLAISPNPASSILEIRNIPENSEFEIKVYNAIGSAVHLPTAIPIATGSKLPTCFLDVSRLANGIYWIEISDGTKTLRAKFMKSTYK